MGKRKVQGKGSYQSKPEVVSARRASAMSRSMNFGELSKPLMDIGPGSDKPPVVHQIHVDTKSTILDFCGVMGEVLKNDLFFPGPGTILKLEGLMDVLGDIHKDTTNLAYREQITKARRVLSNFIRSFRNLYFYEASHKDLILALTNFFLDFSSKLGVDVCGYIRTAPRNIN